MDSKSEVSVDARIGKRLQEARGKMPQADLARRMKELGHRWSQSTVWATEKGERSLKLAEAKDLSDLLDKSVYDFIPNSEDSPEYITLNRELAHYDNALESLLDSLGEWESSRSLLKAFGQWLRLDDNIKMIPEHRRKETLQSIDDAVDVKLSGILNIAEAFAEQHFEERAGDFPDFEGVEFPNRYFGDYVRQLFKVEDLEQEAKAGGVDSEEA